MLSLNKKIEPFLWKCVVNFPQLKRKLPEYFRSMSNKVDAITDEKKWFFYLEISVLICWQNKRKKVKQSTKSDIEKVFNGVYKRSWLSKSFFT